LLGHPRHFALARALGRPILPGSDPLPFSRYEGRAGRCGFILEGQIDARHPASGLKELLVALETQPRTFGDYENPVSFVRAQIAMQLRRRSRGSTL
jgi:hypothetical protein